MISRNSLAFFMLAVGIGIVGYAFHKRAPKVIKENPSIQEARSPQSQLASPQRSLALKNSGASVNSKNSSQKTNDDETDKAEIFALLECHQNNDCDLPKTDPKSYEVELNRQLSEKIGRYRIKYAKTKNANQGLYAIAQTFIQYDDGFVQSEALKILKMLPLDPNLLTALSNGIVNTTDALVAKDSLPELARYLGTADEAQVHDTLESILKNGSHYSALTVASGIIPFLNDSSFLRYQSVARKLSKQTEAYRILNSTLTDFEMRKHGG